MTAQKSFEAKIVYDIILSFVSHQLTCTYKAKYDDYSPYSKVSYICTELQ